MESKDTEIVNAAIKRLKQGLLTGNHNLSYSASKVLFDLREIAAGQLLFQLDKIDLEKLERPEVAVLFAGLLTLLQNLDDSLANIFITKAMKKKCHQDILSVFRIAVRNKRSNFRKSKFDGIEILEEIEIGKDYHATQLVKRWLENVPNDDLNQIPMIYIINYKSDQDFAGNYMPHLGVITLVWYTRFHPLLPIQYFVNLFHERTLYHEIGHHFHKHVEFGQVPEQEDQANDYMRQLMRNCHPKIFAIGRIIRKILPKGFT